MKVVIRIETVLDERQIEYINEMRKKPTDLRLVDNAHMIQVNLDSHTNGADSKMTIEPAPPEHPFQLRYDDGEIRFYDNMNEAFERFMTGHDVEKISWDFGNDRLVIRRASDSNGIVTCTLSTMTKEIESFMKAGQDNETIPGA